MTVQITVEKCKRCGANFRFDSETVPHFRMEAAPLILVYVVPCPACQGQNTLDLDQPLDQYLEEMRNADTPEGYLRCPDCAESIPEMARVCRFCNCRLAPPPAAEGRT